MPKMKTHRATAKRVKFTGTGKIKRNKMNKRHLLNAKTSKRKARLRKPTTVDKTMESTVKRMLPYGN
ncbi:MAG: 50S ribosomal protein L35 [Clostridia bacterium]|nr:50S ribosomal protein L35 [Clostridia bacterium]